MRAALVGLALSAAGGCADVSAPIPRVNDPGAGRDRNGPYYHQLFAATSPDGVTWTRTETLLFEHASQPSAVRRAARDTTLLYFLDADGPLPETLAVASAPGSSLQFSARRPVSIDGAAVTQGVEPCAVAIGDTIRLFYRATGTLAPVREIRSAWSTDGRTFRADRDVRFRTTRAVSDPDVYEETPGVWVMLLSVGDSLWRTTATTSSGPFVASGEPAFAGAHASGTYAFASGVRTFACREQGIVELRAEDDRFLDTGTIAVTRRGIESAVCDASVVASPVTGFVLFFRTLPARADQ